eukprot:5326988-Alexandrium_andersonii.AAC.1
MSASLVGSEMCIRDRLKEAAPLANQKVGATSRAAGRSSAGASEASSDSVSYTHLTLPTICSV